MFDKIYKNVPYFGVWADDEAPFRGTKDAVAVLADAAGRCYEEDARSDDVARALAYLKGMGITPGYLNRFRNGLEIPDSRERYTTVNKALQDITKHL